MTPPVCDHCALPPYDGFVLRRRGKLRGAAYFPGNAGESAFTLVEILGVIAIVAVLTTVTMPLLGSFSRASSRRAAVNLVHSALDQARALALSTSSPHYLVLANGDQNWPETCRYRAFAIFRECYNEDTKHYDRLPVGSWTILPEGIAFKPSASKDGEEGSTIFSAGKATFYCQPAERELDTVFLKFNSVGALEEPGDPKLARIRLFEGGISKAGEAVPSSNAASAREELLVVSRATGRAMRTEPEPRKE